MVAIAFGLNGAQTRQQRHRFPPQINAHAVWLCFRLRLSRRLGEEMLLERGIVVSYETIGQWALKFGADYARRQKRRSAGDICDAVKNA